MDEGISDDAYSEDIIQGVAGTLYAAGTETVRAHYLLRPSWIFITSTTPDRFCHRLVCSRST